uniref:Uncharacterized protein n=1 Tax=Cacopsylla melanoneura TaxID=428564 RepID=A0A8D8VTC9_9HEMI
MSNIFLSTDFIRKIHVGGYISIYTICANGSFICIRSLVVFIYNSTKFTVFRCICITISNIIRCMCVDYVRLRFVYKSNMITSRFTCFRDLAVFIYMSTTMFTVFRCIYIGNIIRCMCVDDVGLRFIRWVYKVHMSRVNTPGFTSISSGGLFFFFSSEKTGFSSG